MIPEKKRAYILIALIITGSIALSADELQTGNRTGWNKFMDKFIEANKKIEEAVVDGYKVIENGVVEGYKAVEDGVVTGYKKIEKWFVETFMVFNPQQGSQAENVPGENSTGESVADENVSGTD